jgi:hypothetical protein
MTPELPLGGGIARWVGVLLIAFLAGCSSGAPATLSGPTPSPTASTPAPTPSPTPTATEPPEPDEPEPFDPAVDRRLPRRAKGFAAELRRVARGLDDSIASWRKEATRRSRPMRLIVRQALYQQRLTRRLARNPGLARRVRARSRGDIAADLRANTRALGGLFALARPVHDLSKLRTGRAEPPKRLLSYYRAAERRFAVRWEVLAAVNLVESAFNKLRSRSYAGAQGPMQFLPSTWDAYGMGGDIRDPRDAIMGAANYLSASGAPEHYRRALFAYNPADAYVEAIMSYARRIILEPRDFFVYYSWQVYVLTRRGPVRITGPGL